MTWSWSGWRRSKSILNISSFSCFSLVVGNWSNTYIFTASTITQHLFLHSICMMDMNKQPTKFHLFLTSALWRIKDKHVLMLYKMENAGKKRKRNTQLYYRFYEHFTTGNWLVCSTATWLLWDLLEASKC